MQTTEVYKQLLEMLPALVDIPASVNVPLCKIRDLSVNPRETQDIFDAVQREFGVELTPHDFSDDVEIVQLAETISLKMNGLPKLVAIMASDMNNGIGMNDKLPWGHDKQDLMWFKKITNGAPMIMGRVTFESLPGILPGRHHYVMTYDPEQHQHRNNENVTFIGRDQVDEILERYKNDVNVSRIFVVGGAGIYRFLAPRIDTVLLRVFDAEYECDTYFSWARYGFNTVVLEEEWEGIITSTTYTLKRTLARSRKTDTLFHSREKLSAYQLKNKVY